MHEQEYTNWSASGPIPIPDIPLLLSPTILSAGAGARRIHSAQDTSLASCTNATNGFLRQVPRGALSTILCAVAASAWEKIQIAVQKHQTLKPEILSCKNPICRATKAKATSSRLSRPADESLAPAPVPQKI